MEQQLVTVKADAKKIIRAVDRLYNKVIKLSVRQKELQIKELARQLNEGYKFMITK